MIVVIQQSLYLGGWLGSIVKIAQADTFCTFDVVQFSPKTFQNRNKIRTKDGWTWLTVPVFGGHEQTIAEVEIDNHVSWRRKHLRSIELNYAKAGYFGRYHDAIRQIYSEDWRYLVGLNERVLRWLLGELGLKTKIVRASSYEPSGKSSELVLGLCRKLKATKLIVGDGARSYTKVQDFAAAGIEVEFQLYEHPWYEQCHAGFESNMAALDLLLNHGPESLGVLGV